MKTYLSTFGSGLLVLTLALFAMNNAVHAQKYTLTKLGVVSDVHGQEARGINYGGKVVGQVRTEAFLWDATGGVKKLGALQGGDGVSIAVDINVADQVVGYSATDGGVHAFLWDRVAGLKDLGDLPGGKDDSRAVAINDGGYVVGHSAGKHGTAAFRWHNGTITNLFKSPDAISYSVAMDINNNGQVVGGMRKKKQGDSKKDYEFVDGHRAFLWDESGGITDLGDLPGGFDASHANAINKNGHIVGYSSAANKGIHAFIWTAADGMKDLGILPGGEDYSEAYDINNSGQVVGKSVAEDGENRAVLWDAKGNIKDLNDLVDASGSDWTLLEAISINSSGQIVGRGRNNKTGALHGFLLTPVKK